MVFDVGVQISIHTMEKILQRKRDAGPLQYHEDLSVVHTAKSTREVSEKNPRVIGVTSSERDRSGLNLEDVVSHNALGHTSLDGGMHSMEWFRRPTHIVAQAQGSILVDQRMKRQ